MTQDLATYYVWIGGSCDYGHKERAGGAAVVIEQNGKIISKDVIADLHTTEFRMMLTLMVKVMNELPEGSDILFLTNAAYIIWTGLGAIGTLLIGILFFGDSASLLRMFFALLTLVGIVGLELTSK